MARFTRNYRVNDEDIDLPVLATENGEETLSVVEVKTEPNHGDVGSLLAKTELVQAKLGHPRVQPVLAAVYLGREVEAYARRKNVLPSETLASQCYVLGRGSPG